MKEKKEQKTEIVKTTDQKKDMKPTENNEMHKGYNEKNPGQPQGAFTPDSKTGK